MATKKAAETKTEAVNDVDINDEGLTVNNGELQVNNEGLAEDVNTVETAPVEVRKYKLVKNVKYGDQSHKIGEKIEIAPEHLADFIKAKAIEIDEE